MNAFGKNEILSLLRELDKMLDEPAEIIICGGAAGILGHEYERRTMDIDILESVPKLSSLQIPLIQIAQRHEISEKWLNDSAKGYIDYLPADFRMRLKSIGKFKKLKAFILGKADLLIMKLAAFRAEDIRDISIMGIKTADIQIIKQAIDKISEFDGKKALAMMLFLKEKNLWRNQV